jgi:hypothetical protein
MLYTCSMMKISNSLEGRNHMNHLRNQMIELPYNPELRKLYVNCDRLLNKLGNAEVEARRMKSPTRANEQLQEFIAATSILERLILLVKLSV